MLGGMARTRSSIPRLLVVLAAGAAFTPTNGDASGQRPSLTRSGQVIWNLDALLRDTYGSRTVCWDGRRDTIFAVGRGEDCPAPEARYQRWDFAFLGARDSEFRRVHVAKEPRTGATNVAVRVGRDYVSCPHGQYHHGRRGWLVFGGGAGPTAEFWCN
jgi:hypothetical protein